MTENKTIANQRFGTERALYHLEDTSVIGCQFAGEEDGESALKECRRVDIADCTFDLRYPLWHTHVFRLTDSRLTEACRAAIWYASDGVIRSTRVEGVKCLRECDRIAMENCTVTSPEFGWRCRDVSLQDSCFDSVYFLFECRNVRLENVTLHGKYSFQYIENMHLSHCTLDTKDAFWHTKNVTAEDCEINGEYLGWYSENLTLIRCHIRGTQPLCYCKNLRLIDCTMENTDLSFEYSSVEATVRGSILSVKNPASGSIVADAIGKLIAEDSILQSTCAVTLTDGTKLL